MSGTFTTTIASYLFLDLKWSVLSQDIPNNRSRVRLTLELRHTGSGIWFSAPKNGVLQGSSFTYTSGFSGSGTRVLQTRDIWVNHNSDGTRTQNFNATFDLNITYQGTYRGRQSVSGNATLPTIPRSSEVTAFSMASNLQISTGNSVNVRLNVYSDSFRFDVALRYGSTTIATWNNQNFTHNTSRSLSLSTGQVDDLLSAMRNTTSGTVTIRVQTKSGSGGSNIGSVQTRNATATVHSNVTPTATGLSVSIRGDGRDKTINHYVQGISRADASFTGSARGGAGVSSRSIVIRRQSDNGNTHTINSGSGSTGTLSLSGTYSVVATVTDTRGRTASTSDTFTVQSYTSPRITNFRVHRDTETPTTVSVNRSGSHSPISGSLNPLSIIIESRQGSGNWEEVDTSTNTTGSFSGSFTHSVYEVTLSYDFRIRITDSFNNSAEAVDTVSTQKVLFDKHKDIGIGIGKIHEQGALDIAEGVFFSGVQQDLSLTDLPDGDGSKAYWANLTNGTYMCRPDTIPEQPRNWLYITVINNGGTCWLTAQGIGSGQHQMWKTNFNTSSPESQAFEWKEVMEGEFGSNSNGEWIRYSNGIQVCWNMNSTTRTQDAQNGDVYWTGAELDFPASFVGVPSVSVISRRRSGGVQWAGIRNLGASFVELYMIGATTSTGANAGYIAYGRWY